MAHTPGPWVAIPMQVRDNYAASKPIFSEGLWRILPEDNMERCPIAEVDRANDHHLPTRLSAADDARLIASAPDLFEAVQNLMGLFDTPVVRRRLKDDALYPEVINQARAAVARAKGE